MGEENEPKKVVNRYALAVLGVALMFINLWMSRAMANDFKGFLVMVFLVNGIIGLGFASVYRTITRIPRKDKTNADGTKGS